MVKKRKKAKSDKLQVVSSKYHLVTLPLTPSHFVCPTCKYEAHKLAGYSHCPLCLICERCKKRVRHCSCKEGE